MGFDKHVQEDHCYMDDTTQYVGMNVEIIEGKSETSASTLSQTCVTTENATKRLFGGSCEEQNGVDCEKNTEYLISNNDAEYAEDPVLILLKDEKLVKPGDKFETLDTFVQYLNENAKRWYYYYSCSDSRKPNTEYESYTYRCVYLKNKEKYKKKGLRKRNNNMKTNCPCKIELRRLPNEKELTAVYVCNYHDHELSSEHFCKLQHGRKIPPYVKEEIMDLIALQVDKEKIRNYVEMETGLRMRHPFLYGLEKNMEETDTRRVITEDRLHMLGEKIAAVDEMYGNNDDKHSEEHEQSSNKEEVSTTTFTKKVEPLSEVTYSETLESVKNLEELVKCEIQKNPWVSDECLQIIPNKTVIVHNFEGTHSDIIEAHGDETEKFNLNVQHYNSNENTRELTKNEFCEMNGFVHNPEVSIQDNIGNIAYETAVIEDNEVIMDDNQHYIVYVNEVKHNEIAVDKGDIQDNNILHFEIQNNQDTTEVDYTTEDNEHSVEFINESNAEAGGNDVGVQTNNNIDTGQALLPVFDVYMKDGNVMGFVVNNNAMNGLKDGVDIGIQTSEDIIYSDIQEVENEDFEIIGPSNDKNRDTYTKHEYIHRYNIEHYMTQSNFPKYVQILAKETDMDVLNMFTNVYNEKAMFKLTTTQKENEGNTRIRYITHNGKIKKKKTDDEKREKFGKNLQSLFILKEKMRMLKKTNSELVKRNEYLQDVALKLVTQIQ